LFVKTLQMRPKIVLNIMCIIMHTLSIKSDSNLEIKIVVMVKLTGNDWPHVRLHECVGNINNMTLILSFDHFFTNLMTSYSQFTHILCKHTVVIV